MSVSICGVYANDSQMGFKIRWISNGFGEINICQLSSGQILIDSEYMGKEFVKKMLCELVDKAEPED